MGLAVASGIRPPTPRDDKDDEGDDKDGKGHDKQLMAHVSVRR